MPDTIGISLFAHLRDTFAAKPPTFRASQATLVDIGHTLEDLVLGDHLPAVLFIGFEDSRWHKEPERYLNLADVAQQLCIFAGEQPAISQERQITVTLHSDDPLREEWFLLVLTEHFAALLCGLDLQEPTANEANRIFDTIFSCDPAVIAPCIDLLLGVARRYRPDRADELDAASQRFATPQPRGDYATRLLTMVMDHAQRRQDLLQDAVDEGARLRVAQSELEQVLIGLAVPVIPLVPGVLVVPLVGNVDSRRSQQVMESLLEGISTQQADVAILDVTGVPLIDTNVANNLLQTVQAANMLGASVIITGIGADIAQTLVYLEVDFARLRTAANLQTGIEVALALRGLEIRPMKH
ncbi:MAG: STAS domain-containing protein [Chloroflexales bacterium]|nr:STAS domain-containing protein [Chloroflexales bacterium]